MRSPTTGEPTIEIDDGAARAIDGVTDIVPLPWGVAVVAVAACIGLAAVQGGARRRAITCVAIVACGPEASLRRFENDLIEKAPVMIDYLDAESAAHFDGLKALLDAADVPLSGESAHP